jgi:hypothetical protein
LYLIRNKRYLKDARKRILREAESMVTNPDVEQSDEITRIGVVWAGILDLDDVIPPTTVAAMLASSELVQATSTSDSEQHWVGAAAYAAMGAFSEIDESEVSDGKITPSHPVGFAMPKPPHE